MAARTIFITGAASGIGRATARHFAGQGWFVGLADIDEPGLAAVAAELGEASASVHRLDVRDREGWRAALAVFARRTDGRLDVLVNNAGIGCMGFLEALSEAEVDDQIDINLKGVINGCRAGIALLAATPGSMVVNMASVAGVAASARMSVYAATKFAVRGLSEALELEYSRLGVGVRCIMPWFLDTAILDKTASGNQDLRAMLKAGGVAVYRVEEASEAIWRAVHGQAREHMVGAQARRLALLKRFAPGLVRKRLLRQIAGR